MDEGADSADSTDIGVTDAGLNTGNAAADDPAPDARNDTGDDTGKDAPDDQLAALAAAHDDLAFEQLFVRHRYRVARIASRFFNRAERIEDVAQEVFTKAYFALPDYKPTKGASFAAWLARITVNCCYDVLRRDRRRPENSLDSITEEEASRLGSYLTPGAGAVDCEAEFVSKDLANKLLARLEPDDRIILALMDIDSMSVADISQMTGWSKSRIKVRAHRARKALRRVVSEYL